MRKTIVFEAGGRGDGDGEGPRVRITAHAAERMLERRVSRSDLVSIIESGEPIEDYSISRQESTRLLLAWVDERPLHLVVAEDLVDGVILVVTVYEPTLDRWQAGFRRRR